MSSEAMPVDGSTKRNVNWCTFTVKPLLVRSRIILPVHPSTLRLICFA